MSDNMGKKQFASIEIPELLPDAVRQGIRRGKRTLFLRSSTGALSAVLVLLFVAANIPALYARAAEIPFLAPIAAIMRVGSGGSQTTGAMGLAEAGENALTIAFTDAEGKPVPVPAFSAARRELPRRVTLRIHGLAENTTLSLAETLKGQKAVQNTYALSTLDSEEQGVILHLNPGWDCTIVQQDNMLQLQFTWEAPEKPAKQGYVLSSGPMLPGNELARLTEDLLWEGATQLQLSPQDYRVVLGEFRTMEQARKAQEAIENTKHIQLEILPISPETP